MGSSLLVNAREKVSSRQRFWSTILIPLFAETNLRNLLKSQHDKIEEIKKATNYYSTRDLLEKYDELVSNSSLQRIQLFQRKILGPLISQYELITRIARDPDSRISPWSARKDGPPESGCQSFGTSRQ